MTGGGAGSSCAPSLPWPWSLAVVVPLAVFTERRVFCGPSQDLTEVRVPRDFLAQ